MFGEFGLVSQLGSTDYARPRKFREKLEGWLKLVRAMWPECPAQSTRTAERSGVEQRKCLVPGVPKLDITGHFSKFAQTTSTANAVHGGENLDHVAAELVPPAVDVRNSGRVD